MQRAQARHPRSQESKLPESPAQFVMDSAGLFPRFAIFQTGGKQYQALEGKTVAIEKLNAAPGEKISFTEVLLRKTATDAIEIGTPFLTTPVKASVVKQMRGQKIIVFKFKRRKKSRVKKGHRQPVTVIRIEAI